MPKPSNGPEHFTKKITVIGGLGRGVALYDQLKALAQEKIELPLGSTAELKVEFVDLSFRFKRSPETWQGPFPFFNMTSEIKPLCQTYSVLTRVGPLEIGQQAQVRIIHKTSPGLLKSLDRVADIVEYGPGQTLAADYDVVALSSRWNQPVLPWQVEKYQRSTKPTVDVEDMALSGSEITGVLLKTERSELSPTDRVVWSFSSAETAFLSPKLSKILFSSQKRAPIFSWVCFAVDFAKPPQLPPEFLWVPEPMLNWSHCNCVGMRMVPTSGTTVRYQAWIKIPEVFRFSNDFIKKEEANLAQLIQSSQIPGTRECKIIAPVEASLSSLELGPSLFCSYLEGDVKRKKIEAKFQNIHFLSFEQSQGLTWADYSELGQTVFSRISRWWTGEVEALKKRQRKQKLERSAEND